MSLFEELLRFDADLATLEADAVVRYGPEARAARAEHPDSGVPEDVLTVGLVGGTGVGKSTIVNALAGLDVSRSSARRPTTDRAIPYVHRDRAELLDRMGFIREHLSEARTLHDVDALRSLVLFDLPDIDSIAEGHGRLVEEAMRGLDLVVWVTSLTKYGDRLLLEWIARHGRHLDRDNAVFVVNKIDQIDDADPDAAVATLERRFRGLVAEALGSSDDAGDDLAVFLVAARDRAGGGANDFPAFARHLFRERDDRELARIKSSNRLADAERRLIHLRGALDLDRRTARIDEEVAVAREALTRELDDHRVSRELDRVLETSPVPGRLADLHYRRSLAGWPLLSHLSFLASPFRRLVVLLRQLHRLTGLEEADLRPEREEVSPLIEALEAVQHARRRHRSRRASLELEAGFAGREREVLQKDLQRFQNECDLALEGALDEERRVGAPSGRIPAWRRAVIWAPLAWFPFLQPLVLELLEPGDGSASLLRRLGARVAQIAGATHLLVSLLFVLLVYLGVLLVLRAAAFARARRQCRRHLESSSWRTFVQRRLERLALEDLDAEAGRLRAEAERLDDLETRRRGLQARIEG
ncbi:MAG: GTPase [Planctomycetota bacterium]